MNWNLSKSRFSIASHCLAVRPELGQLASQVADCCYRFLPSAWADLSTRAKQFRRDNYFFRFTVPVAELAGWPTRAPKNLPEILAAQLLWCFAWRSLDDALDASKATGAHLRHMLTDFSRALAMTLHCAPNTSAALISRITTMYSLSCEIAEKEHSSGIKIREAWKRSSQFFIVPTVVLKLKKRQMLMYRQYINTAALTHDIHDLFADVQQGIATPPVRWLRQTDPDFPFRPPFVHEWFRRAATELDKQVRLARRNAEAEHKILSIMLDEAEDVLKELRQGF